MPSIEIIGHRGFSAEAPENTLAAMRAALKTGAEAVEWDVQVAACGTPMVIHDATVDRTTNGTGRVDTATAVELQRLDAGNWFGPEFVGERIPTLAEALEELKPYGASVYVEVKACRGFEDLDRMAALVADLDMESQVAFISLDFSLVDHLAKRTTATRLGYVVHKHQHFQDALGRARRLGPRGLVDLDYRMVLEDPLLVPRARAQGVDLAVWTVNEVADAAAIVEAGIFRLTTNEVSRLLAWRGPHAEETIGEG